MRTRGREIYIITAVVAVVLIVAWYFLLFSPTQRKLSDLDTQIQSAQSALDMANQEVVKLESYKKTAPQSRAEDRPPRQDAARERGHPGAHHRAHEDG